MILIFSGFHHIHAEMVNGHIMPAYLLYVYAFRTDAQTALKTLLCILEILCTSRRYGKIAGIAIPFFRGHGYEVSNNKRADFYAETRVIGRFLLHARSS